MSPSEVSSLFVMGGRAGRMNWTEVSAASASRLSIGSRARIDR
jgi:hypothetical protein